jgi:phage terminase large subunit
MAAAGDDWRASYDADELIALSPRIPRLVDLCAQFSQPTYSENGAGKILIDKAPDGAKSPNDADAVMIVFAPGERKPRSFFD